MTTLREAATLALEALENSSPDRYPEDAGVFYGAKEALRTALSEPEQEPVAWANMRLDGRTPTMLSISQHPEDRANWVNPVPLYTHPPQRKPLSDEEIWREYQGLWPFHPAAEPKLAADIAAFARAIERAHGIGGEA